jgi:hypothetical protein
MSGYLCRLLQSCLQGVVGGIALTMFSAYPYWAIAISVAALQWAYWQGRYEHAHNP